LASSSSVPSALPWSRVTGGDYDLTTPDGRLSARIVGAVARQKSEDRSRRVRRKHLELAEHGRPAGQLGWGVRTDDERELVREAAQRVLAGHGLMTMPATGTVGAYKGRRRDRGRHPPCAGRCCRHVWRGYENTAWTRAGGRLANFDRRLGGSPRSADVGSGARRAAKPERNTNVRAPSKYLLTGLIHCGTCGNRMSSRPRGDHTKRYLCSGNRPGHQLGLVAQPVDDLASQRVLGLVATPSFREALLVQSGAADGESLGRTLADLGAAQSRLQRLDDDFYIRGSLPEGRYRSIKVKLEREIDRLRALANAGTKQRIALDLIRPRSGQRQTFNSDGSWSAWWSSAST
jgi:site-specific DNA recombinase